MENKDMKQMDMEIAEHMLRYATLSENICKEVDERRRKRKFEEYQREQRKIKMRRMLWIAFLLLCCVIAYFVYKTPFGLIV